MTFSTVLAYTIIAFAAIIPSSARACRDPGNRVAYLHPMLPALNEGEVAAEVEVLSDTTFMTSIEIEARVIKMMRGEYSGSSILIKPFVVSSCDAVPRKGDRGVVVGRPLGVLNKALVIDPRRTLRQKHGLWDAPIDLRQPEIPKIPPLP